MASVDNAYMGEITIAFDYKANVNSSVRRIDIEARRIKFLMIENVYENTNILPVVYVSIALPSDLYTKVVSSNETSKFYLRIRKKNALSGTSVYRKTVEDTFTYVTSTTSPNFSDKVDMASDESYKLIMIGLVSDTMTNTLRKMYNGVYQNIDQTQLIKLVTDGLGKVVMAPLKYNKQYPEFIVPPTTSRYKLLYYLFEQDPFYDSMFTFFMDFDKSYIIPKNGNAVDSKDGNPNNVIINIKDYTASEAYTDGYSIDNGAYVIYVNGVNVNIIVNNSTSKVVNNVVGYWDQYTGIQDLNIDNNNTADNTLKTTFIRSNNAAALRNEIESDSVILELLKQNLDGEIFEPNRSYNISNYTSYEKYNGSYFLIYKREFYYPVGDGDFIINTNVGLKKAAEEEAARTMNNQLLRKTLSATSTGKTTTTKSKTNLKSKSASRSKKQTGYVK